jgi:hypothetical protein
MYAKTILAMNVSSGQSRMPNRIIAAEIPDSFAIFFSFLVFILLINLFMIDLLICVGGLCWPALLIQRGTSLDCDIPLGKDNNFLTLCV